MPSTHRFSHAVSRLFRALHKKPRATDVAAKLLAPESLALTSTELPAAFFKLVRSLVERLEKVPPASETTNNNNDDTARVSSASTIRSSGSSSSTSSSSSSRKQQQHKDSGVTSDCYARLAQMLTTTTTGANYSSSGDASLRSVPVAVALETLLDLWDVLLPLLLQASESQDADNTRSSAVELLQAVVQRHEFDVALNAVATGACSVHQSSSYGSGDAFRSRSGSHAKRRVSSVRLERAGSFRVVPTAASGSQAAAVASGKKPSRRSRLMKKTKRTGSSSSHTSAPLCVLVRRYLSLHQSTLQRLEDAIVTATAATLSTGNSAALAAMSQAHELLATVMAATYLRIPFLRETMTAKLSQEAARSATGRRRTKRVGSVSAPVVTESSSLESPLPLFQWPESLTAKCSACVAPLNRDESWKPHVRFLDTVLTDADARMVLFANLVQHLTIAGGAWGRVEWPRVPGFPVLAELLLSSTAALLQHQQQQALEAALAPSDGDDAALERASVKGSKRSHSSQALQTLEASASAPGARFFRQALQFVAENLSLLPSLLLTVLTTTNALVPHHVELCLQYLERFITAFPRFFRDEPSLSSTVETVETVDIALLELVFTRLLASEHFEILKATELFLLRTFDAFSLSLRTALTRVLATQFRRLFLHWHRDVRYCYFHALLYLSYAGNRIVLAASSDAAVLGAEAAQLFEISALVRTPAMTAWDVFDVPLHALLTRYTRATRPPRKVPSKSALGRNSMGMNMLPQPIARPSMTATMSTVSTVPSWVDDVSFTDLARSVPEYQRLVLTYFQSAKQLSVHEPVPVPVFYVKGSTAPLS